MKPLKEIIEESDNKKTAIGHFNVSDLVALKAIFESASDLDAPVVIGVSEGEREFIGVRQIAALVKCLREEYNLPIFLNADHTHSLEKAEEAARAGFDEILFDGSKLPFEQNAGETKRAVEAVKSIDPKILVEGEIGYIGSSSEILKEIPPGASLSAGSLTTPEEARQFVAETGIDVLAPAVGNMHGLLEQMAKGELKKHLNVERIREIKEAAGAPLTLHGGSGTAEEDLKAAISAGINIVHISTEIRVAWRKGIEEGLKNNPQEVAPYKIYPPAVEGIKKIVSDRLRLFNRRM